MVLDVRNLVPGQSKALLGKSSKTNKKSEKVAADGVDSSATDSVEITGQAGEIQRLIEQMKAEPVLDPDRVSPIKEKLQKGEYEIKYEQVANKMLDFESSYYGY